GSPPLGPGCLTGTERQGRVGHGPTPAGMCESPPSTQVLGPSGAACGARAAWLLSTRVVNVATMRKRILTAVAIIGCLALIAVALLVFWFAGGAVGGGITSVGETSLQYVSISPDRRISLVIWSDSVSAAETSSDSGLFGAS